MSSIHVLLPSQYLQRADTRLAMPQKRLMIAVLEAVLHDCDAPGPSGLHQQSRDLRTQEQAMAYVENRDRSWPFSFDNICDAIGLDADGIRRALQLRVHDVAS